MYRKAIVAAFFVFFLVCPNLLKTVNEFIFLSRVLYVIPQSPNVVCPGNVTSTKTNKKKQ